MVLVVIVSVILTGLVLTIAWSAGVQSQIAGANIHTDQALQAAESAGQWAVWQFKNNNTWRQTTLPANVPTLTIGNNTFSTAVTCVDAGAAATLYWPFSEGSGLTTADTSGNGNTGTLVGGVTWTTAGKYGNALAFDGTSGYVDAGAGASTNIVSSVTMAAWVKMNTAAQDQKVGGNQDGYSGGYKMSIYGLRVEFETRDANNTAWLNRSVAGGTILTMGTWYHVTGVFDQANGVIKTYVNGVLDRSLSGIPANALTTTTGDFIMGREPWINGGTTRYFNGTIDDVRVYNRALSDQEIMTLANTSVHIHSVATLQTPALAYPPVNVVDFICSAPTPQAPIAPAITVGGNLPLTAATVSGDVQVTGNVTGVSASSVNGKFNYGGTYTDSHNYITITYKGKSSSATKVSNLTVPTINYANIQSQAISTTTGGSNQTFAFGYLAGQINIIYVNGNCTDPVIDTSQSGGTLLINGNLTLTKNANFGSSGFPAYVIVEGSVNQTGGSLTMNGGLYINNNWSHNDVNMTGDIVVGGSVTDNTQTSSTYVYGPIPWFDPRVSAAAVTQPMFNVSYQGANP
jgi:hypothetical protein